MTETKQNSSTEVRQRLVKKLNFIEREQVLDEMRAYFTGYWHAKTLNPEFEPRTVRDLSRCRFRDYWLQVHEEEILLDQDYEDLTREAVEELWPQLKASASS